VIIGGTSYYYVKDVLGSVAELVNTTGTIVSQYTYDPYGNQTTVSGSASDIGYAGYFTHTASGLDFAMYRAYDPAHARWLNRDPIGEAGGANLYAYAGGNPTSTIDPLGYCPRYKNSPNSGTNPQDQTWIKSMLAMMGIMLMQVDHAGEEPVFTAIEMEAAAGMVAAEEAETPMVTVLGSARDVEPFVGVPGFNTFTGEGIAANELNNQNMLWLEGSVQNSSEIWLVTDPVAHQLLMNTLGKQSAYLDLELPALSKLGLNAIPKYVSGQ
jgi:RHS repeat-associated protein